MQIKAYGGETQTDADELMAAGAAATLSVGLPMRYMHSPFEVAAGDDVEAAARLVAALAQRLDGDYEPGLFLPVELRLGASLRARMPHGVIDEIRADVA